ncbi:MAG: hypothetical protein KAS66_15530, partial [Candidatus Omnitrophica bacterium]|nr:hypothetical protein [Candidatus Omnitrophota bacterium]
MFDCWLKGLRVRSIQVEVFGAVVEGQESDKTAGIAYRSVRPVGATVFSSSSPANLQDVNAPVLEYLAGNPEKRSCVRASLLEASAALIEEIRGNIDRFKLLNAMLDEDGAGKIVILSPGSEESQEEILRSAQDDGSEGVKNQAILLSRHQPPVTVPHVPRTKEISQNRLEAIEDTEHMARKLEGLTADPNKAPPGTVINVPSASNNPPVDPVNAKKSSRVPEILFLLPKIADDYFMLATGTASSPVNHDSKLPLGHRWVVIALFDFNPVSGGRAEGKGGGQKGHNTGQIGSKGNMPRFARSRKASKSDVRRALVVMVDSRGYQQEALNAIIEYRYTSSDLIQRYAASLAAEKELAKDYISARFDVDHNLFIPSQLGAFRADGEQPGSIRVP